MANINHALTTKVRSTYDGTQKMFKNFNRFASAVFQIFSKTTFLIENRKIIRWDFRWKFYFFGKIFYNRKISVKVLNIKISIKNDNFLWFDPSSLDKFRTVRPQNAPWAWFPDPLSFGFKKTSLKPPCFDNLLYFLIYFQ